MPGAVFRIALERGRAACLSFLLSPEHVAALLGTALLCAGLPYAARARPGRWVKALCRALGLVLAVSFAAYHAVVLAQGSYSLGFDLPLHLTDAVTVIAALALWTGRPLLFELTYFWGLSASLQAVLTPSLEPDEGFSSFFYWHYFATHAGVVLAAVLLAFGLRLTPRSGAVGRVFLATAGWTAVAAVGTLLTGGNYMFLRERPETRSLLDVMGPWPWYILVAAPVALALFVLLDMPFWRRRRAAQVA